MNQNALNEFQGHADLVYSVCYSPDNKFIVSSSHDRSIKFWSLQEKKVVKTIWNSNCVTFICFTPQGQNLLSGDSANNIKTWDIEDGKQTRVFSKEPNSYAIEHICITQDEKYLISCQSKNIIIWDFQKGTINTKITEHKMLVNKISLCPKNQLISSASDDKIVGVFNFKGETIAKLQYHDKEVRSVCFSPVGNDIVSGSADKTIIIWDCIKFIKKRKFDIFQNAISYLQFTSDSKYLCVGQSEGSILILDYQQGKSIRELKGHRSTIRSLALSKDEQFIISGSADRAVRSWKGFEMKQIEITVGQSQVEEEKQQQQTLQINDIVKENEILKLQNQELQSENQILKEKLAESSKEYQRKIQQMEEILNETTQNLNVTSQNLNETKQKLSETYQEYSKNQQQVQVISLQNQEGAQINLIEQLQQEINLLQQQKGDLQKQIENQQSSINLFEKSMINSDSINLVGEGGFGKVFKVEIDQKEYAEKIIEINLSNKKQDEIRSCLEILVNEINIMSKVSNDSQKQSFNAIKLKGIALDYLRRQNNEQILQVALFQNYMKSDLDKFMQTEKGKQFETKKLVLIQICDSLIYFTNEKLAHGDLKPANVMIDSNDNAFVGDFGTATIVQSTSQGKGGELFGYSINYAAPEMLLDEQKYIESDYWSLGAIIMEYLLEARPYGNLKQVMILNKFNSNYSYLDYYFEKGGSIKSDLIKDILVGCTKFKRKERIVPLKVKELLQQICEKDL